MLKAYLKIIAVILTTVISCAAILSTLFESDISDIASYGYIYKYASYYDETLKDTPATENKSYKSESIKSLLYEEFMEMQSAAESSDAYLKL